MRALRKYLLNGSLVDSTAFVDEMSCGGGLAGVDVADNDAMSQSCLRERRAGNVHVHVCLLFTHASRK
jgi:hypothetical protein